jgi:hypothetical protein
MPRSQRSAKLGGLVMVTDHERAVARRGVAVEGVKPEDDHDEIKVIVDCSGLRIATMTLARTFSIPQAI